MRPNARDDHRNEHDIVDAEHDSSAVNGAPRASGLVNNSIMP
jgi:hypothetical protein